MASRPNQLREGWKVRRDSCRGGRVGRAIGRSFLADARRLARPGTLERRDDLLEVALVLVRRQRVEC